MSDIWMVTVSGFQNVRYSDPHCLYFSYFLQKSPVTFLRAASALDRLLVLCDATLYVINASDLSTLTLSGSPKFKGVTACCVNENPNTDDPFSVQVR